MGKARELVPGVVDGVDERVVGAQERLFELEVVGRVGEDEVDAVGRQPLERRDAVADQHLVERKRRGGRGRKAHPRRRRKPPGTRDLDPGGGAGGPGTLGTHGRTPVTQLNATTGSWADRVKAGFRA